ncbi:DUF5719 family protein [Microbacterium sp. A94]|uniref:DUF5719 family protein n=1 Tax=Microbacterium sp. A94 TaxID=3450717 RepID=UPI003F442569
MTHKPPIRVAATSARLVAGAVIAVACVAGVTAAVAVEWPSVTNQAAQMQVRPAAGDTTVVCSGSFRAIGRDANNAQQMSSAGDPALTVDSNGPREESELAVPDLTGEFAGPQRFIGSAEQGGTSLVAAAESVWLAAGDLSGLAASACREPQTESWLLGGTVETGTSDLIILSNPGDVTATAALTVFGTEQTTTTTLVPAGTQLAVPLASIAAGLQQPVVRVTATGAPLRAVLQSSLIRTLDPSGIDLQDTAGVPGTDLTFSGVQVVADNADSAVTVLRLLAADQPTTATITVRSGAKVVQTKTVPLEAAIPAEVNLDGLDVGVYSVSVEADSSLVGAVWQSTGVAAGSDFAWMTQAPEITGEVFVAVPAGPAPRLHLVNRGDEEVTATLAPTNGQAGSGITVAAGGSTLIDVTASTTYALAVNGGGLHAAVALADVNQLAGWPLWPAASERAAITVYP